MGGRHSRNKGASYERETANLLKSSGLDDGARRNVQESQIASVDILTKLPLAIQCKCLARWSYLPHDIWHQANDGKLNANDMPIGVVRITRKSPDLVILSLDDFINMAKQLWPNDLKKSE